MLTAQGNSKSGQALLIVLLVLSVVLTIALSVASRSITDISISQKEDEAARAFSAAEAGIEQALSGGLDRDDFDNGTSYEVAAPLSLLSANKKEYILPMRVGAGESVSVWFADHDDATGNLVCNEANGNICSTATNLTICWGEDNADPASTYTPALEASFIYMPSSGTYRIARAALDPYTGRPGPANNFDPALNTECTIDGKVFEFQQSIDLQALGVTIRPDSSTLPGLLLARLKLYYSTNASHQIGVKIDSPADAELARQGNLIESTGTSGNATRKIQVKQMFRDLPPVFDYAIFSGTDIIK